MTDCDNFMERKDLRKVVYGKKGALQERSRKKNKGVNFFARSLTSATYPRRAQSAGASRSKRGH